MITFLQDVFTKGVKEKGVRSKEKIHTIAILPTIIKTGMAVNENDVNEKR